VAFVFEEEGTKARRHEGAEWKAFGNRHLDNPAIRRSTVNKTEMLRILDSIARDRGVDKQTLAKDLELAMVSAARKYFNAWTPRSSPARWTHSPAT
jgi:hypothetical protein